jgi:hypothetical protein
MPAAITHGHVMAAFREQFRQKPMKFHLILRACYDFCATNARDKIFAYKVLRKRLHTNYYQSTTS